MLPKPPINPSFNPVPQPPGAPIRATFKSKPDRKPCKSTALKNTSLYVFQVRRANTFPSRLTPLFQTWLIAGCWGSRRFARKLLRELPSAANEQEILSPLLEEASHHRGRPSTAADTPLRERWAPEHPPRTTLGRAASQPAPPTQSTPFLQRQQTCDPLETRPTSLASPGQPPGRSAKLRCFQN